MVQLHKKDDRNDQWIPLTTGECVQLTDYENNGETGDIEQTDDLNTALAKLENDKAAWGETLSAYGIADAYTKDEVDAMFSGIYRVRGGLAFASITSTLADSNTKEGDVYNLTSGGTMTSDFIEYESGVTKTVDKGTNIVVVNTGTEQLPVLKMDVLAMSASQTQTQSDWSESDTSDAAYIKNKPTVETAAQDGTDESLVTTGEKYVWNGKQDALPSTLGKNGKCLKVIDNNGTLSWEDDNDVHVNTATFSDDTTNNASTPIKMTLAMSDGTPVTANIPKVGASGAGVVPKGASVSTQSPTTKFLREDGTWATPSYTSAYVLPTAADGTLGGIQIGYTDNTANTRNYPVQLDEYSKAFVNVPWTDTDPIPSQSGNNNKFLMTNGSTLSWATPSFRAIQVDNTQLLATDANKAFDIIGGKNITLTTDNSQQGYASVTIDVTVGDVPNPTITSNVLAVEYGKNYFVGSSTATASGVAADQNPVSTLGFTVSGNSGFEANVFFRAGASGSGMKVNIPSGFLLIGEQPEYVSGNVYLISFYKGTAIMGEMTVSQ